VIGWVDELHVGNEWDWHEEEDRVCLVLNLSRLLSLAAEGQICDLGGMGKERPAIWGIDSATSLAGDGHGPAGGGWVEHGCRHG
jgi:hypothetical protein